MRRRIEIDEVAGPDVNGTGAEARRTGVETIEISRVRLRSCISQKLIAGDRAPRQHAAGLEHSWFALRPGLHLAAVDQRDRRIEDHLVTRHDAAVDFDPRAKIALHFHLAELGLTVIGEAERTSVIMLFVCPLMR